MKGKLLFAAGVAVGYVWGTRTGREGYDRLKSRAQKLWGSGVVQENVHEAAELAREKAPDLAEALSEAAKKFTDLVSSVLPGTTEPRATDAVRQRPDVGSDPAHSGDVGRDWTDEGGAGPEGPATNTRPS